MSLEVCTECIEQEKSIYQCSKCSAQLCIHKFRSHKCGNPNLGLRAERSARRKTDTSKDSWEKQTHKKKYILEIKDDLTFTVDYPWFPFANLKSWIPTQRSYYRTENTSPFDLSIYLQGTTQINPDADEYQRRYEHDNWVRYKINSFIKTWGETNEYFTKEKAQRATKFQMQFPLYLDDDIKLLRSNGITINYSKIAEAKLIELNLDPIKGFEIEVFAENDRLVIKWSHLVDRWFNQLILIFVDFLTIIYYESESRKTILPVLTQTSERELRVDYWAIFRAMDFWRSFERELNMQKYQLLKLRFTPYKLPSISWHSIQKYAKNNFKLRPYQENALSKWEQRNYFGSEQLPTGSGKTVIGIGAIWDTKDRTLILVPNLDLVEQWKDRIITFLGIPSTEIGIFSGHKKEFDKDIVISTYQLLSQYIKDYLIVSGELPDSPEKSDAREELYDLSGEDKERKKRRRTIDIVESAVTYFTSQFGLLLADECHHVQAKTFKEIALKLAIPKRLALSATIEWGTKSSNTSLIMATMGPVIYDITYGTLSKAGFIPPILYRKIYVSLSSKEKEVLLTKKGKTQGFRSKLCREAVNKYPMIKRIINSPVTSQILIFTSRISHAEKIYEYLNQTNIKSHLLVGTTVTNTKEREDILQQFRNKHIQILILVKMLNEGFDAPADTVIVVSGSRNRREHIQRCGRTTRLGHIAKIFEIIVEKDDLDTEYLVAEKRDITNIIEPWIQDKLIKVEFIKKVDRLLRPDLSITPTIY